MADRWIPHVRAAALAAMLLLPACNGLPRREEATPRALFPTGWTVLDLTRPLDRDAPYLHHADSFPFERLAFVPPDTAFGPKGSKSTPLTTGAYTLLEHQGTHLAAPRSTRTDGRTVDAVPPGQLVLELVVVDLGGEADLLTRADLDAHERLWGPIPAGSAVVLRTGQGGLAGSDPALLGKRADGILRFPGFDADAVEHLTGSRRVAMLGTDALALDAGESLPYRPAEVAAADAGVPVLVALADLSTLPARGARIVVGVLPVRGAAGAAARVLALLPPPERLPQPLPQPDAAHDPEGGAGGGDRRAPAGGPR